jgi:hypothetical protein
VKALPVSALRACSSQILHGRDPATGLLPLVSLPLELCLRLRELILRLGLERLAGGFTDAGRLVHFQAASVSSYIRSQAEIAMSTDTAARRAGAYFSVSVRAPHSLCEIVSELNLALRTTLERCSERGLEGDWQGEALGLRLWLFVAEPPGVGVPPCYALIGGPRARLPAGCRMARHQ